jgi:hypothetical protein
LCIYANAFVAGKQEDSLILPEHPEGLLATLNGVKNTMFSDSFSSKKEKFSHFTMAIVYASFPIGRYYMNMQIEYDR